MRSHLPLRAFNIAYFGLEDIAQEITRDVMMSINQELADPIVPIIDMVSGQRSRIYPELRDASMSDFGV